MKTKPTHLPAFLLFLLISITFVPSGIGLAGDEPPVEVDYTIPVVGVLSGEDAERDRELTEEIAGLTKKLSKLEIIEPCREQLALRREALGEDDPLTIEALHNLGRVLGERAGKFDEAEPLFRLTLAGWERLLDPDHPRILSAQDALGYTLTRLGKFEEAEPLLIDALAGRRRVFGNDDVNTISSVHHLGSLYRALGRLEEAEPYYREAFETSMRAHGADHPATLTFQNNMGFLLHQLGRFAEAETHYRQALAGRLRALGEDHRSTLNTTTNLGTVLIQLSRYEESESLLETALAAYRRLLGDEHRNTLKAINNLGLVLERQGRFTEAEVYMREAVATNRRTLGVDIAQTLTSITNLAGLLKDQGRMAEAEAVYFEALEGDRRALGDRHPDTLSTMHNLTRLLQAQGRLDEAVELLRLTHQSRVKALGPEHPDTLRSLDNLGVMLFHLGHYEEAEAILRRALDSRRRIFESGHSEIYDSAGNLGMVLSACGRFTEAERLFRQSLDGYQQALGPDNPRTLAALSRMGRLHRSRGEFDRAEAFFLQALEGRRRVLGSQHPDVVRSLNALAELKHSTGDYQSAESLWWESAAIFETARLRASARGLERAYFAEQVSPLAPLAACLVRNGKPGLAWTALEENQARGLLDALSARHSRPLTTAERDREIDLIGRLSRIDERISVSSPTESDAGAIAALHDERARLQAELARFGTELTARYGPSAGEVFDLVRIQRSMPPTAALVGWVDIPAGTHSADPAGEHWACVVRHQGEPRWVRLPGSGAGGTWTEADDQLAGRVRHLLGRAQRKSAIRRNQALFKQLCAQRIDPLLPCLEGAESLIVLPAGVMSGIPIEVLETSFTISYAPSGTMYAWLREKSGGPVSPAAGESPLLLALGDPDYGSTPRSAPPAADLPDHGVLVAMVTDGSNAYHGGVREGDVMLTYAGSRLGSAADLEPAIREAETREALAGDPDEPVSVPVEVWRDGEICRMELTQGTLGLRPVQDVMPDALLDQRELDAVLGPTRNRPYERLPGSRREVEAIAGLFETEREEGGNEILLGADASERRLDALSHSGRLKQFGVIHLATHGMMNDRMAMQSALILARREDDLAGATAGSDGDIFDGRLTGEQIVRTWALDADLVTLSGCETGLGRESGGEGYLGFSQAMFIAGARSLLLSLWKVNDQATMLLMTRFYENLLGKFPENRSVGHRHFAPGQQMSRALALREAKQWLAGVSGEELRAKGVRVNGAARGAESEGNAGSGNAGAHHPFADPHFWAAFVLLGDPG